MKLIILLNHLVLSDINLRFCWLTSCCLTIDQNLSPGKKKVHFETRSRDWQRDDGETVMPHEMILKRLQVANLRAQTSQEAEKICPLKSRQILGIR